MLDPTRLELLQKSRSFLDAPEIRSADETTKKEFLKSKGLQEEEITQLLAPESNSSPQAPLGSNLAQSNSIPPPLPPKTYPQLPPSRVPDLLAAFARLSTLFLSVAGGTALFYYIFVLPRLIRTLKARHSIKLDQLERLSHLSTSAENLDNVLQDMSYSIESLSGVPEASLGNFEAPENENSPPKTYRNLIRAILSSAEGTQMSASEIASKAKTVFNVPEDDLEVERLIRRELTHQQFFDYHGEENDCEPVYSVRNPQSKAVKLDAALERLITATAAHRELASDSSPLSNSAAQKTLQSISELTALVSGQTYSMPSSFRTSFGGNLSNRPQDTLGPAEEEVRKELRALKGLLLNRRTFASVSSNNNSPYRPSG